MELTMLSPQDQGMGMPARCLFVIATIVQRVIFGVFKLRRSIRSREKNADYATAACRQSFVTAHCFVCVILRAT